MKTVKQAFAFEWDKGNSEKPKKHGLTLEETEEVFLDDYKVIFGDWKHSVVEQRVTLLCKTRRGRLLNVTYTMRKTKIRVITARPINKREVKLYEKAT